MASSPLKPELQALVREFADWWATRGRELDAANEVKEPLYHYTNMTGLLGVVSSEEMWFTNIQYKYAQNFRSAFGKLVEKLPNELRELPEVKLLASEANEKVTSIVQLIYFSKKYEGIAKDFEFSRRTMEEHWQAGYKDALHSLSHPEALRPPSRLEGVRTFDFGHYARPSLMGVSEEGVK